MPVWAAERGEEEEKERVVKRWGVVREEVLGGGGGKEEAAKRERLREAKVGAKEGEEREGEERGRFLQLWLALEKKGDKEMVREEGWEREKEEGNKPSQETRKERHE